MRAGLLIILSIALSGCMSNRIEGKWESQPPPTKVFGVPANVSILFESDGTFELTVTNADDPTDSEVMSRGDWGIARAHVLLVGDKGQPEKLERVDANTLKLKSKNEDITFKKQ